MLQENMSENFWRNLSNNFVETRLGKILLPKWVIQHLKWKNSKLEKLKNFKNSKLEKLKN